MLGWLDWRWLRGIYSPHPPKQPLGRLLSMGAPDTVRCASHVTQPLGFSRFRPLELCLLVAPDSPVHAPDRYCALSGVPLAAALTSARSVRAL
jgi:hypothetical protein